MKYSTYFIIVFCVFSTFFFTCSGREISADQLQKRGELYYAVNEEDPYSGQATELYENGQKKTESHLNKKDFIGGNINLETYKINLKSTSNQIPLAIGMGSKDSLKLINQFTIKAGLGIKCLLYSKKYEAVYALNLEDMSVFVYTQKVLVQKLKFEKTPGKGWDYDNNKPINSFEEKPVEGYLTDNDKNLFISLHNAGGIVVWPKTIGNNIDSKILKKVSITNYYPDTLVRMKTIPFFATGKTPKVMTSTNDDSLLFISNWHSKTISIMDKSSQNIEEWKILRNINLNFIPRGLLYLDSARTLYVAAMSNSFIHVIDLNDNSESKIEVGRGPRHLIMSKKSIYASLNSSSEIVKINIETKSVEKRIKCLSSPRTIKMTDDGKYLFVVNYNSNYLQCFDSNLLREVGRWKTDNHPVALEIIDNSNNYEIWVGNYSSGTINIFQFRKDGVM